MKTKLIVILLLALTLVSAGCGSTPAQAISTPVPTQAPEAVPAEMAAEEAAQEAENIGRMSQEDVEDYMEALDASSASVEDDFLDLDDVADRVTKK